VCVCVCVDALCVGFGRVQMEIASLFWAVMLIQSVAQGFCLLRSCAVSRVCLFVCVCVFSSGVKLFCVLESGVKLCQF